MENIVRTKQWHFYLGKVTDPSAFKKDFRMFAGTSNPALTAEVASYLGVQMNPIKVKSFNDGEVSIKVHQEVRGADVYIIQPVCRNNKKSVNDALMELLLLISTMRRASAANITAIVPYFAYARQDRKLDGIVPISAADVAHMISGMGCDRVVSIDLHCGQIQGFFPPTVPVDNIPAGPVGAVYFSEKNLFKPVVVSPDAGGVTRAKEFRQILEKKGHPETGLAMIIKQRSGASKIERMDLVGTVEGRDCILVDDMVDTAGTLCKAADMLKKCGARRVMAFCTHGLFSGPAPERIAASCLDEIVVTNTVPMPEKMNSNPRLKVLSISPIIAETVRRIHMAEDMSDLYRIRDTSGVNPTARL